MDDRQALMAAIIANPQEDTPRLVFADWLQEHGDKHDQARAEFIRLQIKLAQLPEGAESKKLAEQAKALDKKHRKAWLKPLSVFDWQFRGTSITRFTRGLVDSWIVMPGDFLRIGGSSLLPDALAEVGVERLDFYDPTKRLKKLTAFESLRWFCHFEYSEATEEALAEFARSPNLT
ncbi:MAG: TIGR02996 domain-containing protein, partial [Planctomycetia bacterium]|nr:TIGR02996 domain-containing protein [Planctomycetia bacterium]